jgi:hypothetical protein
MSGTICICFIRLQKSAKNIYWQIWLRPSAFYAILNALLRIRFIKFAFINAFQEKFSILYQGIKMKALCPLIEFHKIKILQIKAFSLTQKTKMNSDSKKIRIWTDGWEFGMGKQKVGNNKLKISKKVVFDLHKKWIISVCPKFGWKIKELIVHDYFS